MTNHEIIAIILANLNTAGHRTPGQDFCDRLCVEYGFTKEDMRRAESDHARQPARVFYLRATGLDALNGVRNMKISSSIAFPSQELAEQWAERFKAKAGLDNATVEIVPLEIVTDEPA